MASVTVMQTGRRLECLEIANLLQTLLDAGVFVDNPCNGTGVCGKCKVRVVSGKCSPVSETERAILTQEEITGGIRLSCMTEICSFGEDGSENEVEIETLQKERKHKVLTKGYMPEFVKDEHTDGYGVVIDIGTTTVVTALIDRKTGQELANASMINAQKHYGLDVLTRITYEYEHPECGIKDLQDAIVHSINVMIGEVCGEAGVDRK